MENYKELLKTVDYRTKEKIEEIITFLLENFDEEVAKSFLKILVKAHNILALKEDINFNFQSVFKFKGLKLVHIDYENLDGQGLENRLTIEYNEYNKEKKATLLIETFDGEEYTETGNTKEQLEKFLRIVK